MRTHASLASAKDIINLAAMCNPIRYAFTRLLLLILTLTLNPPGRAAENPKAAPPTPREEAERALKKFVHPAGFKVELIAHEPALKHPVAFSIDEKGRFFISESHRFPNHVLSVFSHLDWLDDDLASTTHSSLTNYVMRRLGTNAPTPASKRVSEIIRLLEDRDGDGKPEHSSVFASGFDEPFTGTAEGVLAWNGNVWFTVAPDVWRLKDQAGKGVERKSLLHGFGVHLGYAGHELHSLRLGPDGKLYFSMGDRGFHVESEGRTLARSDSGGVFRCNLDGSDPELLAWGLRNPMAMAFDDRGNLFVCDNNADIGDRSRWVQIIEGADYGWRIGFQYMERVKLPSPWHAERLWHLAWPGQPAWHLPPLGHASAGPSGMTFNPGTGLASRFDGHFFLADWRAATTGGILAFANRPKGASYEISEPTQLLWEMLVTDVQFGVEGGLYLSDWVQGWGGTGKGRLYRLYETNVVTSPIVQETKRLIGEGMNHRAPAELAGLLAHRDQRVRQNAQFALADKRDLAALAQSATRGTNLVARLHAIWGLGQLATGNPAAQTTLLPLLADGDAEIRTQAARVLGDARAGQAFDGLAKLLTDPSQRVQLFAVQALGKLGRKEAVGPVLSMLAANTNHDAYLRHAGVFALVRLQDTNAVLAAATHASSAVRMAALLTLRRWESPAIARFLNDADPLVITEAAIAINDQPIPAAFPDLAALLSNPNLPTLAGKSDEPARQALVRRVVNAHFRLGQPANAAAIAAFARNANATPEMRAEAINALADWHTPPKTDRVIGLHRPVPERPDAAGANALRPVLDELLLQGPDAVRIAATKAATRFAVTNASPALHRVVADRTLVAEVRVAALASLAAFKDSGLAAATRLLRTDPDEAVRIEAMRLLTTLKPAEALPQILKTLRRGTIAERQDALTLLPVAEGKPQPQPRLLIDHPLYRLNRPAAGGETDRVVTDLLDRLLGGKLEPELNVELIDVANGRKANPAIKDRLEKYRATLPKDDHLAQWREGFYGGNAAAGKRTYYERYDVACQRCHKLNGQGGEGGPDLTGIGSRATREYLLESIVFPNRQIAKGFENATIVLQDGRNFAGIVQSETNNELVLNSPEDGVMKLRKTEIKSRDRTMSGMPEEFSFALSRQELRNLVEFLASLK